MDQKNECEREEAYPGGFSPLRPEFHGEPPRPHSASDHHFDPAAIAALSCAQTLQCNIFSWCYQRLPQPIPVVVTCKENSLVKNIDFPQKLISNLKQSNFQNRSE